MKAVITDMNYIQNKIILYGRNENKERIQKVIDKNESYFFVKDKNGEYKTFFNESLKKITVNPKDIKSEIKKYHETWEGDIKFVDKIWVDLELKKGIDLDTMKPINYYVPLRKNYIDIENDDSNGFPDPKIADKEIFCYTIIDNYTNIALIHTTKPFLTLDIIKKIGNLKFKLFFYKTEKEMLIWLSNYLKSKYQPDVILGWNVDDFDVEYLKNRMKNLSIDYSCWNGIVIFDLLKAYRRWKENKQKSYKLDYIAKFELGYGKIPREKKVSKMNALDLAYYNYIDVKICYELDEKLGLFKYFYDLSEFVGSLTISRWNASYLWDFLLLHRLKSTNIKLPTGKSDSKIKVKGGTVLTAASGFFRNVKVLDFKSEYPNLIYTFNISPDAIDSSGEIIFPDVRLKKEPLGIIPQIVEEFIQSRDKIKKEMKKYNVNDKEYAKLNNSQRVVKEITNSIYGLLGNEHYRLYDERIQKTITYGARHHIKFVIDFLTKLNVNILYGDTDSVMIQTDIPINDLMKKLNEAFDDFTKQFGVQNKSLYMKFEKEYDAWIQLGAKKRYIGIVDGNLDYKGIELRRSDNSDYTQWVQKIYFTKLFLTSNDINYELGKKNSKNFYNDQIKKFDNHDKNLIAQIGIWASVKSDLNYSAKKFWVAEAVKTAKNKYNFDVDISSGKVKIYFLNNQEAVAFNVDENLPKKYHKMIDWNYHKIRCLINPLEEFVNIVTPEKTLNSFEIIDKIDDVNFIKNNIKF